METAAVLQNAHALLSPLGFAVLVGLAALCTWLAFAPSPAAREVGARLDDYLPRADPIEADEMARPFAARVLGPALRAVLGLFGRLAPLRNLARTEQLLIYAGRPGGLSALDLAGLRVLVAVVAGAGFFWLTRNTAMTHSLRLIYTFGLAGLGYFLPFMWLRMRARRRQREIERALPDALDMMTIGVEAGLGFESAMLKVAERWDNALSRELRRVVAEMRVGTPRDEALRRLAERTGVDGVRSFVSVLIQSSQLGVSIARVLHTQADQERLRRRQRAEELARQAGGKMVFPLVVFMMPTLFIVILGPSLPTIIDGLAAARAGMGAQPR